MDRTTPVIGIQERIQEQDYGEPTNLDHPDAIAHVPDALWDACAGRFVFSKRTYTTMAHW